MKHLALAVSDQQRSRLFYETYFGFDAHPTRRYDDGVLMLYNRDGFALALAATDESIRLPTFLHFGIGLPTPDDVHAFRRRLAGDGIRIVEEWDEPDYVSVKCHDPDGYVVEAAWEPNRLDSESPHAYYLRDLGFFLREHAEKAARAARRPDATEFEQGRRMAYYEVISLMQDQAQTFELPLADLAFEDLDPDEDILSNLPVTTEPRDRRLLAAEAALMREHEQRGRARKRTVRRFLRAFNRSPDT